MAGDTKQPAPQQGEIPVLINRLIADDHPEDLDKNWNLGKEIFQQGDAAIRALIKSLDSVRPERRVNIILALAWFGPLAKDAVPKIIEYFPISPRIETSLLVHNEDEAKTFLLLFGKDGGKFATQQTGDGPVQRFFVFKLPAAAFALQKITSDASVGPDQIDWLEWSGKKFPEEFLLGAWKWEQEFKESGAIHRYSIKFGLDKDSADYGAFRDTEKIFSAGGKWHLNHKKIIVEQQGVAPVEFQIRKCDGHELYMTSHNGGELRLVRGG